MEFERLQRRTRELPLTPLIDVVFILIVFFMLTTSFMKIESLELMLPTKASSKVSVARDDMARIFIQPDGAILFGGNTVEKEDMRKILQATFAENSEQKVVVFSADNVSMQRLVDVMDMVYVAGGKSLFVREWDLSEEGAMVPTAPLPKVNIPVVPVATQGRRSE